MIAEPSSNITVQIFVHTWSFLTFVWNYCTWRFHNILVVISLLCYMIPILLNSVVYLESLVDASNWFYDWRKSFSVKHERDIRVLSDIEEIQIKLTNTQFQVEKTRIKLSLCAVTALGETTSCFLKEYYWSLRLICPCKSKWKTLQFSLHHFPENRYI